MVSIATDPSDMKVAILQNYPEVPRKGTSLSARLADMVPQSSPPTQVSIFRPINGDPFPDLGDYDLVILTGGRFNLLDPQPQPAWVSETLAYIRKNASQSSGPKLLGICWGHQAISYALGGALETRSDGPCIGVETISLTNEGSKFFDKIRSPIQSLNIHKFHVRYVSRRPEGFVPLANNNEVLISASKGILSMQGHPELTESMVRIMLSADDGTYCASSAAGSTSPVKSINESHDGQDIFAAILSWARS
ncbi:class I glutamine amidotransferase-like protein [Xylariales sp. PMI_506]|nr:class I glutamine amidotransferase-like protein [Xylariales sp. PMI_506]